MKFEEYFCTVLIPLLSILYTVWTTNKRIDVCVEHLFEHDEELKHLDRVKETVNP